MTEDEAKTTTCHKTLIPVSSADGSAPWFSPQPCIGSACMAWRSEPGADRRRLEAQNLHMPTGEIAKIESGWCGLAGKP